MGNGSNSSQCQQVEQFLAAKVLITSEQSVADKQSEGKLLKAQQPYHEQSVVWQSSTLEKLPGLIANQPATCEVTVSLDQHNMAPWCMSAVSSACAIWCTGKVKTGCAAFRMHIITARPQISQDGHEWIECMS